MPGGYVVRDANEEACPIFLHHLMQDFGTGPVARRDSDAEARQAKVLTKDEARRIAVNIARQRAASVRQHLLLTRPCDRCVEQAGDADPVWQPTCDGGFDEARCEMMSAASCRFTAERAC
jgi:hypothetical protein